MTNIQLFLWIIFSFTVGYLIVFVAVPSAVRSFLHDD